MREIRFRAWVECGTFVGGVNPYMNYYPEFHGDINEIFRNNGAEPKSKYGSKITYMQFTGLKDKNGKDIYEGDIVEYSYLSALDNKRKSSKWVVEYETGMYWLRDINKMSQYDSSLFLKFTRIEVVGNVRENSKLLEDATCT